MSKLLRKSWYSLIKPGRVAVLDYAVNPMPLYTPQTQPHKILNNIISDRNEEYKKLVEKSLLYYDIFQKISLQDPDDVMPAWENDFFPAVDYIMLYTILSEFKPKKYLEIGSGNSTKVAHYCRGEEKLDFTITCIDPNPRRKIKEIADVWLHEQIQSVDLDQFRNLQANDILFLDGSHVLHPNSDVMWFFLEILPIIPKGVIIHIHDIFLPYDYPQWVCDRFFSEQYMLAACLLNSDNYRIISPNYYILTEKIARDVFQKIWEIPALQTVKKHGRSFWFSKT